MSESRAQAAERMRVRRLAERRARAVWLLQHTAALAGYAAGRIAGDASPGDAQMGLLVTALELERLAGQLRKLAGLSVEQRLAAEAGLLEDGVSVRQCGELLGVSHSQVLKDQRAGRGSGEA